MTIPIESISENSLPTSPKHYQFTFSQAGHLVLEQLPFQEGDTVEVIIRPVQSPLHQDSQYPLRNLAYFYPDPFEPAVPLTDWEILP